MSSTDQNAASGFVSESAIHRAPDWRVVYCNILGIGWGENEARLNVAFDEDLAKPGSNVREELIVVMPHRAAKILAHTLSTIIANYEANNGPIPFPQEKLQEIDSSIKEQASRGKPVDK
ncbi:hypothetical protein [Bradyrhizobium guangdongense]|uniref:DUF3467 domain-containing protein n=1 Tax=Bradyrhizobium guangdongense TaxID=1325090 RepID=A0AA87W3Q9_9BRAD|nr:hypothetical protein [Bradyrhizobium guangdongense]GGI23112.1 hypothetical protein GCM10010987_22750 [Bradyrhizobium guangdongense]